MPKKNASPERQCIITKAVCDKSQLLRFVVAPDGTLTPDWSGKLPGRGMYVTLAKSVIAKALAKNPFARAAKMPVRIPDGLAETLEDQAHTRALEALSMARKGGLAIAGFEKVQQALQSGEVVALLHATDAGADGIKKLSGFTADALVMQHFSRTELAQVMGRENPVHVAILAGNASDFFVNEARRFALFIEKTTL